MDSDTDHQFFFNGNLVSASDCSNYCTLLDHIGLCVSSIVTELISKRVAARHRDLYLLCDDLHQSNRKIYQDGQVAVYTYLSDKWPNIQQLLSQAADCLECCYPVYMQVAIKAETLLVRYCPDQALQFYRTMTNAVERFGSERDLAIVHGLLGMAVTQGSGTEWAEALDHFNKALPVLRGEKVSVDIVRLLCDMGLAYFRLNKLPEADYYLQDALTACQDLDDIDDIELRYHLIRVHANLALPAIFRGQWAKAKTELEYALGMCKAKVPNHPILPEILNRYGLLHERSGDDQDKALEYYCAALKEKEKYADWLPDDLVAQLNNIGMQFPRRGDFNTAMTYLKRAQAIRSRAGRLHYFTALTEQHLGVVCFQRGDFKNTESHLLEAAAIYKHCTPGHDIRGKVELCLAHVYVTQECRDVSSALKHLKQVWALADERGKENNLSDDAHIVLVTAVEHLTQLLGWQSSEIQSYLILTDQRLCTFVGDVSKQLSEHHGLLKTLQDLQGSEITKTQKEGLSLRISKVCHFCTSPPFNQDFDLWGDSPPTSNN